MSDDLYKSKERLLRKIEEIKNSTEISQRNKDDIIGFQGQCSTIERLSDSRVLTYMCYLEKFSKNTTKNFVDFTKDDVIQLIGKVEKGGFVRENKKKATKERFDYSSKSLVMMRVCVKKFFRFLRGIDPPDYPNEVKFLRSTVKLNEEKVFEILPVEKINQLIDVTENPRDRAFISVLFESACRPSEIINLRIKDIEFDDFGAKIFITGKTGKRRLRIIQASSYLATWLNCHPTKHNIESKVWVGIGSTSKGKDMGYRGMSDILKKNAEKIGIKNIHLYTARHSYATILSKSLPQALLGQYLGHAPNSRATASYIHLSGDDLEEKILRVNGLKPLEEKTYQVIVCPRCGNKTNPPNSKYCHKCGFALDLKTVAELEKKQKEMNDKMDILMEDREVQEVLKRKIMEFKL